MRCSLWLMGGRDDFKKETKVNLALRVGTLCSNPSCNVPTHGPHSDEAKVNSLGHAAHICAAAEGGPRYDANQTPEQRSSIRNGIWLCVGCANKIDRDPVKYPVSLLHAWKAEVEAAAHVRQEALASDATGLRKLFDATDELLSWPQELADGIWLDRPEVTQLVPVSLEEGRNPIVLLGTPGSGKSALLARTGANMKARGWNVVAIKADHLPNTINTTEDLNEYLGLVAPLRQVVFALSTRASTALLVDQLDAVSDLTDQHSGRLDVLLRVVRQLSGIPGILVLCSARKFDFDHDVRFSHLDAQQVELSPVSVEELAPVLGRMGLDAAKMPPKLLALLRTPQWLRAFQRLNYGENPLPTSWQTLLERVWHQLVLSPSESSTQNLSLVNELARQISEREELWVYRATLDTHLDALNRLLVAGLLTVDASGRRVGFSHQTFYEFARVRAFLESEDLLDFVRDKEGSLFVRPVVWAALEYLREPSSERYHDELRRLWGAPLRSHLRLLLVEFLGKQEEPDDVEAELLLSLWTDPTWKNAVLGAIHASKGWFERVQRGPLLDLMRSPEAGLTYAILWSALQRDPHSGLRLMRREWFGSVQRSALVLRLLARLDLWSEEAYLQAEAALRTQPNAHEGLSMLLWGLKKRAPEFGVRLLAVALERDLRETMKDLRSDRPPSEDAPIAEHTDFYINGEPKKTISALIRRAQESSLLIELSEVAPTAFLENLLPWLSKALEPILTSNEGWQCYREDGLMDTRPGQGGVVHELGDSLKSAARRAANGAPDEFLRIVRLHQEANVGALHLCLSFGFRELKGDDVGAVVEYLLGDARRLCLGDALHQFWASVDLLRCMSSRLDENQVRALEAATLALKPIPESQDRPRQSRWHARRANRRVRFHLLGTLPMEHLSQETRALLEQESRVFSEDDRPGITRVSEVGPTMSVAQMESAQDQHVVGLFKELVDETGFNHPRRWLRGGSVQAAREFGELAKKDWRRAVRIIHQLDPETNTKPIAHALRGMTETDAPTEAIIQLVDECVSRGASTTEFRDAATETFRERAHKEKKLSPRAIAMLELWLEEASAQRNPVDEREKKEIEPPFLWGYGVGVRGIPDGSYWYLKALMVAHLVSDEPRPDEWLKILSKHLDRDPTDPAWLVLMGDLRNLSLCDKDKAEAFLDRLVEMNSRLMSEAEWLQLFCHASWWTSTSWVQRNLRLAKEFSVERAYGELICFLAVRSRVINSIREELGSSLDDASTKQFLLGIATSAAHMWSIPNAREQASKVLVRLLEERDDDIDEEIVEHALRESCQFDEDGLRVIEILARRPKPFLREKTGRRLGSLVELIHVRPGLMADLCERMVTEIEADTSEGTEKWRFRQAARDLVEFTLTLQRIRGYREKGLELFERLLKLGIHGASELLSDVDRKVSDGV